MYILGCVYNWKYLEEIKSKNMLFNFFECMYIFLSELYWDIKFTIIKQFETVSIFDNM